MGKISTNQKVLPCPAEPAPYPPGATVTGTPITTGSFYLSLNGSWLHLCNTVRESPSRFTEGSSLFFVVSVVFSYLTRSQFVFHPSADGRLGSFPSLAISGKAAEDVLGYVC